MTDLNEAIARARESVPEDYYVKLSITRGSAQVALYGPEGRLTEFDNAEVDLVFDDVLNDTKQSGDLADSIQRAAAFAVKHATDNPVEREPWDGGSEPKQEEKETK